jgi:hypothetical protein
MLEKTETGREYITTPKAAEISGLTTNYIATLLRQGKLDGFRMARDWFVYTDSLEQFLKSNRKPGPKGPRKHLNHHPTSSMNQSKEEISPFASRD